MGFPAASRATTGGDTVVRVVVADDDPDILMLVRITLESSGLPIKVVGTATDGPSAVDAATAAEDVDVVLLDLMMPGCPGDVAAAQIRQVRPDVTVVIFSAAGPGRLDEVADKLHVDHVVDKADLSDIPGLLVALRPDATACRQGSGPSQPVHSRHSSTARRRRST